MQKLNERKILVKNKTFKESMQRLEEIVGELETNNLELEEAIKVFEEGLLLSKQCDKQLKDFEKSISKLMDVYQDGETNEAI